ncbi:MAG: hypothetical protein WC993_00675 [Methanoculleus sp.]
MPVEPGRNWKEMNSQEVIMQRVGMFWQAPTVVARIDADYDRPAASEGEIPQIAPCEGIALAPFNAAWVRGGDPM